MEIVAGANAGAAAATTTSGEFSLGSIQPGSLTLRVAADGFIAADRTFNISANTNVDIALASAAPQEHLVIVRATHARTGATVSRIQVRVLDGPRAGLTASSESDQVPLQLSSGAVTLSVTAQGFLSVAHRADITGAAVIVVRAEPEEFVLTGTVRENGTSKGIPNAQVESVQGVNAGRGVRTDISGAYRWEGLPRGTMRLRASAEGYSLQTVDVSLDRNQAVNFELTAPATYTFFGVVTDGQRNSVAGVEVRTQSGNAVTDGAGRFEIRSTRNSLEVTRLVPPNGYEPTNHAPDGSLITLQPGQNSLMVRRILRLSISLPPQMRVSDGTDRYNLGPSVTYDTGANENLIGSRADNVRVLSSNPAVVLARTGAHVEPLSPGTATVTATYWGVTSLAVTVQVVR